MGQPKCPSIVEWINNVWSMNTAEFYTATKTEKTTVTSHKPKSHNIMLHKRTEAQITETV